MTFLEYFLEWSLICINTQTLPFFPQWTQTRSHTLLKADNIMHALRIGSASGECTYRADQLQPGSAYQTDICVLLSHWFSCCIKSHTLRVMIYWVIVIWELRVCCSSVSPGVMADITVQMTGVRDLNNESRTPVYTRMSFSSPKRGATVSFHNINYSVKMKSGFLCKRKVTQKNILVELKWVLHSFDDGVMLFDHFTIVSHGFPIVRRFIPYHTMVYLISTLE